MTWRGHIENGMVVLDEPLPPPEGSKVQVQLLDEIPAPLPLGQAMLQFAGVIKGTPPDLAAQHDHYLHGTPKR